MLRALSIVLALAVATVGAGCGSEEEQRSSVDARELLAQAFDTRIESGKATIAADLKLDGVPLLGDGVEIRASGPFTRTEMDLDVSLGGLGPGFSGGLTVTRDNLYIAFAGRAYELGEEAFREMIRETERKTGKDYESLTFEDLGVEPETWVRDARVEGDEQVGGEPVTKITGRLDTSRLLEDLGEVGEASDEDAGHLAELEGFVEDATVEVYVAKGDHTVRRLVLDMEFEIPAGQRGDFAGADGGAVAIDVTLTDIGRPQRIRPPADARPLDDLLRQFGLGPELFQQ